ncbi:MAG TPA: Mpo1-like protein [Steroidobacteraceae bacterium]|nr:Mpo1-like protein [Steroidobacteraceae bacterium]
MTDIPTPAPRRFRDFYPVYLGEHANRTCRRLHFIGSTLVLVALALAILSANPRWLIAMPLTGYGFAWIGHFAFEKNRPATFRHPLYSLLGDWVMFKDILIGRIPF